MSATATATGTRGSASLTPLAAVLQPLPDGGGDPRYGDDFLFAKQQMDKLQGNDYPEVYRRCCVILAEQAKDLRATGYLVMAALCRDGVPGLIAAAEAFRHLLEASWHECHPRSDSARINALAWLNNARFEAMARAAGVEASAEQRAALRAAVDGINDLIRARAGDDAPLWRALDSWLRAPESAAPATPVAEAEEPPAARAPKVRHLTPEASSSPVADSRVTSERDVFQWTRTISDFFREKGSWLQAMAYTRALRWGGLIPPPAEQGRTRVPPPRAGAAASLDHACQGDDPEALLVLCEALYLEPGGQFWLDLQHHACQAAGRLGRADLAAFIADQTASLLRRLPGLEGLAYEDGCPFATSATRAWLAELGRETASLAAAPEGDEWTGLLEAAVTEARALVGNKKLGDALRMVRELPAGSEARRLRLQLAQAGLCLQGARPDVALPLLEALEQQAEDNRLVLWNEALALEVWRLSLAAVQQSLRKACGPAKDALEAQAKQLRDRICRTDPAAAVTWL